MARSLAAKLVGLSGVRRYKKMGFEAQKARRWDEAARFYERHLRRFPREWRIWVQLGHCLKEAGDLAGARAAYERGAALATNDADPHLQLGFLLHRMGEETAVDAFQRSETLNPTWTVADQLRQLGYRPKRRFTDEQNRSVEGLVLVEVNDLFGYLEAHPTLSGIQRVQAEFIQAIVGAHVPGSADYIFVINGDDGLCWRLRHDDILRVVDYAQQPVVEHDDLRELIQDCRRRSTSIPLLPSQTFLVLGAFWGYGGVGSRYSAISRAGLRIGVLIYDLIPITHPEYCAAELSHDFTLSFGDGMWVFDFALTISRYTAQEVVRFLRQYDLPDMPVIPVPLAVERKSPAKTALPDLRMRQLGYAGERAFDFDKPYVLVVSTIEARKNHAYLVSVWLELRRRGVAVPRLVFVGRIGWRVETLLGTLKDMHYLDGDVVILSDVTEAALAKLYAHCAFTAFPSFLEGWGLPVGESLTHGKLCVASNTSSIPEVAGDLAIYVDPLNIGQGIEVFGSLLADPGLIAEHERRIAAGFRERTWTQVSADIVTAVNDCRSKRRLAVPAMAELAPGQVFRPKALHRSSKLPADYPRNPLRLMFGADWYNIEDFGAWMRGGKGNLRFATGLVPGTPLNIYLKLQAPAFIDEPVELRIEAEQKTQEDSATTVTIPAGGSKVVRLRLAAEDGTVNLRLCITSTVRPEHDGVTARHFALGLSEIFYLTQDSSSNDLAAQLVDDGTR